MAFRMKMTNQREKKNSLKKPVFFVYSLSKAAQEVGYAPSTQTGWKRRVRKALKMTCLAYLHLINCSCTFFLFLLMSKTLALGNLAIYLLPWKCQMLVWYWYRKLLCHLLSELRKQNQWKQHSPLHDCSESLWYCKSLTVFEHKWSYFGTSWAENNKLKFKSLDNQKCYWSIIPMFWPREEQSPSWINHKEKIRAMMKLSLQPKQFPLKHFSFSLPS